RLRSKLERGPFVFGGTRSALDLATEEQSPGHPGDTCGGRPAGSRRPARGLIERQCGDLLRLAVADRGDEEILAARSPVPEVRAIRGIADGAAHDRIEVARWWVAVQRRDVDDQRQRLARANRRALGWTAACPQASLASASSVARGGHVPRVGELAENAHA